MYPGQVSRGRMKRREADYEMAAMTAVVRRLQRCMRDHKAEAQLSLDDDGLVRDVG